MKADENTRVGMDSRLFSRYFTLNTRKYSYVKVLGMRGKGLIYMNFRRKICIYGLSSDEWESSKPLPLSLLCTTVYNTGLHRTGDWNWEDWDWDSDWDWDWDWDWNSDRELSGSLG
jgi:hypothetical protein